MRPLNDFVRKFQHYQSNNVTQRIVLKLQAVKITFSFKNCFKCKAYFTNSVAIDE